MFPARGVWKIRGDVQEGVTVARAGGLSHAEVLSRFHNPDDRVAAAVLLSTLPDHGSPHSQHRNLHGAMVIALVFLGLLAIFGNPVLGLAFFAVAILVYRRSPWGYNGVVGLAFWAVVAVLLSDDRLRPDTATEGVVHLAVVAVTILLGGLAIYLRQSLYPYFGLLSIKTDGDGRPALLAALEGRDRTR